jgi:hypothetical protein
MHRPLGASWLVVILVSTLSLLNSAVLVPARITIEATLGPSHATVNMRGSLLSAPVTGPRIEPFAASACDKWNLTDRALRDGRARPTLLRFSASAVPSAPAFDPVRSDRPAPGFTQMLRAYAATVARPRARPPTRGAQEEPRQAEGQHPGQDGAQPGRQRQGAWKHAIL